MCVRISVVNTESGLLKVLFMCVRISVVNTDSGY